MVVILCLHNSSMVVPIVIHSLVITSITIVLQALLPVPFLVCDSVWCNVVQCSAVWVWVCVFGVGWGRGWWRVVLECVLECNVMFGAFVRVGGLERGEIERERERWGMECCSLEHIRVNNLGTMPAYARLC